MTENQYYRVTFTLPVLVEVPSTKQDPSVDSDTRVEAYYRARDKFVGRALEGFNTQIDQITKEEYLDLVNSEDAENRTSTMMDSRNIKAPETHSTYYEVTFIKTVPVEIKGSDSSNSEINKVDVFWRAQKVLSQTHFTDFDFHLKEITSTEYEF